MTMILQQSATFERKSDGAIAIQCSVCFFSGFSTCHCSNSSNAATLTAQPQTSQSSKSKKVSAANAAAAAASASKKGHSDTKNNITTNSNEETHEDAEAAKLRLGTLSLLINYLLRTIVKSSEILMHSLSNSRTRNDRKLKLICNSLLWNRIR